MSSMYKGQEGRDVPSNNNSLRTPVPPDYPKPTFQRKPVSTGRQDLSFSSRGFIPDYMTEQAPVMMPEISRTTLEVEGVPGKIGMMPPSGIMARLQPGQLLDEGAGGAGSFSTAPAWRGKVNG